ncbi:MULTISPECIES: nucleotidyl transferase AbiEii/AbiGii toxin family protein [unclassified Thermosipho (in: thermotogales)]|uniref:nucleotidyl transferase AbiEii/AbiGii toxin family protein n=1 Tax=unclassified Thermosipho (in: thermotogales) TaxID=2676525 RepID=UPI001E331ADE|nr:MULTISPECIES: nucleotidyl transferase AbiEii/AbiGii toxin family protein [unclassified Thermosipho (in: thermotogales)]
MHKLTLEQENVLEKILELDIFHEFYLAGGTSLLLKYNHRPSLDFDFFLLPTEKFKLELYEKELLKNLNLCIEILKLLFLYLMG